MTVWMLIYGAAMFAAGFIAFPFLFTIPCAAPETQWDEHTDYYGTTLDRDHQLDRLRELSKGDSV